ncbi:MAG: response regulator [Acidobacteriota bacterium]|nr:response regulator [Acidobacteriota bacterium]
MPVPVPTPSAGCILVVDDVPANLELFAAFLVKDGYEVRTATGGEAALEIVQHDPPDVVLLDIVMPGLSGFEVCRQLKQSPATRLIPVVLVTALQERADRIRGIEAGADDFLTKPVNSHELRARVRSLVRLKRFTDELDSAEAVILSLALTVEARDRYTDGHCLRLSEYATALGRSLRLPDEDVAALRRGAFLHDLGKIGVPDAILLKPGPLTAEERAIMQEHPVVGERLCGELRVLRRVRPIVRSHHEHLDGSGYPDRLVATDVPLLAQIMGIVDCYDAVTTARPYKGAWPAERGFETLREEVRVGWRQHDLVEHFIELIRTGALEDLGWRVRPAYRG